MRKILFLFTFFAIVGLFGPAARDAAAQCTHLGSQGTCPVGIPNGSNSVSFNPDGTINWNTGGVSGPCCAAPSGTETGGGLLNLNNQLDGYLNDQRGRAPFGTQSGNVPLPTPAVLDADGNVVIPAGGWPDNSCSGGDCTIGPGAALFGPGTNSGYQCDSGGPGCGNDLWVSAPQPGFGACGAGGCGDPVQIAPLNFADIPGIGPYSQNRTTGQIDPFGGGSSFTDPITGDSISLSDDPNEWPDRVKLAETLNDAFVNGKIGYPFTDPEWDQRSVQYYQDNPTKAPVTPAGQSIADTSQPFNFYQPEGLPAPPPTESSPGVSDDRTPVHPVQLGDTLFRIALRHGVSVDAIAQANGISPDTPLSTGQVLTIPVSTPAPVASGETAGTEGTSPGSRGAKYSDKAGRFGIGTDTTLGGVGGLSARFQVAKNFGVQAIVSFVRVSFDDKNANEDLTNYVSSTIAFVSSALDSTQPGTRPANFVSVLPVVTPAPTPSPANENAEETPEPRSEITNLTFAGSGGAGVARIDTEGEDSYFQVTTSSGRRIDFKSRSDAFFFSNLLNNNSDGQTVDQLLGGLPDGRSPINADAATTNPIDAIAESVPKEFQAPKVNDGSDGEFFITDPRTNRTIRVFSPQQKDAALNAMRNGATLEQAAEIAQNAPVVTEDGLASATSSSTPKSSSSTSAPAGSAPTFTDNRPAIIVPPENEGRATVTNNPPVVITGRPRLATVTQTDPNEGLATVVSNSPPGNVRPQAPQGERQGFMDAGLRGQAYRIEIIKTPDGKMLAVGTGKHAGHVFGEVKETTVKIFGDWRREGPWTPPAPAETAKTPAAATPVAPRQTISSLSPEQISNARIRSQIANSDRDHMTQPIFTDGFESGDVSPWRSTVP